MIHESTGWYNWRHTSYHQNTFLCFFMKLFHQHFQLKIWVKGLRNYACSIKLFEFYFQHLSFVFKIQVLCALQSGFQVSHSVALG